jgi:hypothetical protein
VDEITAAAFFDELTKIAADVEGITDPGSKVEGDQATPPPYREHPALTVAKGIGGYGLGTLGGYLAAHGADRAIRYFGGEGMPLAALKYGPPIVGGAAGIGFTMLQNKMMGRIGDYVGQPGKGIKNPFTGAPLTEPTGGLEQDPEI